MNKSDAKAANAKIASNSSSNNSIAPNVPLASGAISLTPEKALEGCSVSKLNDTTFALQRYELLRACTALRSAGYVHLCSITAIDWKTSWEVVYHLVRFGTKDVVTLKVALEYHDPSIPSVTTLWPGAGWHEREAYDLLGITFVGNTDLRRILLPNDFKGHPLRKEVLLEKGVLPVLQQKPMPIVPQGKPMEVQRGNSA